MKFFKHLILFLFAGTFLLLIGCTASTHSTIYYKGYYDPYPCWGCGNDTTIIIDRPSRPDRPSKPPGIRPPGNGNRPKPSPRRR